ncbi:abortive infection family protein [Ensifer canadensis]
MVQLSAFVVGALAEVITGGAGDDVPVGIYRSVAKIEQLFLDCGIMMRIGTSSRVPTTIEAIRRNLHDSEAIARLILRVSDPRDYLSDPTKGHAVVERLNAALQADELAVVVVNGKPQIVQRKASGATVSAFQAKAELLDFDTVQREIGRALDSATRDPEDAATAASSLLESVCRSILVELNLPMPAKKDIDSLVRAVQDPLGLAPGRMDLPADIEGDIRQILSGLTSVAKGVGALRTHAGDAHGRERGYKRIDARIARLSINAAATLATFLIETWERNQHRSLPRRMDGH